jgi:hypothetical protein
MKIAAFLTVALCVILAGCPTPGHNGSLALNFSTTEIGSKTWKPLLDMEVASYDVSGVGPGTATFSQTGVIGTSVAQNGLAIGAWTIVVDAFNADHDLIGTGSTAVAISAGETTTASVEVVPLSGKGTLTINISWTPGLIDEPSVAATLTAVGGTVQDLTFTPGTDSIGYSSGNTLDAGYYWLNIVLKDSGTETWWSNPQSVRILKDQTTAAIWTLTAGNINTGGMSLTITPTMNNPITITLSGQQPLLVPDQDMTVSASTSQTVDTYQWYLNGAALSGQTSSSVSIGSSLTAGNHNLTLGVWKGNVISSESLTFSKLGTPSGAVTTNVAETGADLEVFFYAGSQFVNPLYSIWVEDTAGNFIQDLYVSTAPGTNRYHGGWVARPMSVPYWAHKSCIEDPYLGHPTYVSTDMYLAYPAVDGGPIPLDLDAVTSATLTTDFVLQTARKNDGLSEIRVLLEISRSRDYNSYYTEAGYDPGGQPSLVYGATIQTGAGEKYYTMSLLGTGHPLGSDGTLGDTSNLTTALNMVKTVVVHVKP